MPREPLVGLTALFRRYHEGCRVTGYLDLSSPELKDYANDLFELVNRAQVQKFVFKHSIEEIKGTCAVTLLLNFLSAERNRVHCPSKDTNHERT